MIGEQYPVPVGWTWAALEDVIESAQPGFASGKKNVPGGTNHLRMNNIGSDCRLDLSRVVTVPKELARPSHFLKYGDVLFCHTNSVKLVGKTALFDRTDGPYAFSNHLTRLRPSAFGPLPEWLWLWLTVLWRQGYFKTRCKQWVNQATVERRTLLDSPIPVAPLAEQKRIVTKVEDLFLQLRPARESLQSVLSIMRRFRQLVLSKAFRGDLMERGPDDESVGQFLKSTHELEHEKTAAYFDRLSGGNGINLDANLQLPQGWMRKPVGEICTVVRGASPRPKGDPRYFGGQIPWIMISDITKTKGKYLYETRDHVTEAGAKRSRLLCKGTIILSNSGSIGIPKILAVDGCIHDGFVAFLDLPSWISSDYLYYYFDSIGQRLRDAFKQGITQTNLNTKIVREIPVPLAPPAEQERIVSKVEAMLNDIETVERWCEQSIGRVTALEQSILTNAFKGELVPQNPNDEPASILLERIRSKHRETDLRNQ